MTTTHKARRRQRQRAQHGASGASNAPTQYRPAAWNTHFVGLPALPDDLVLALRNKMNLDDPADAAIAASCRALRERFAAVSGGRWSEEE